MITLTCIHHGTQITVKDKLEAFEKAVEPEKWCEKCKEESHERNRAHQSDAA